MYDDTTASSYTLCFFFPYCKNSCIPYCSKQYYFSYFIYPALSIFAFVLSSLLRLCGYSVLGGMRGSFIDTMA
jgi:hypothetical protein